MSEERNRLHWQVITAVLGISFVGIGLCALIQKILFKNPDAWNSSPVRILSMIFLALWILGLPFGAFNPHASLPKWFAIPFLVVFWLVVAFFLLFVGLCLLGLLLTSPAPQ